MTARADLLRALGTLCEPPEPEHGTIARSLGLEGRPEPGDYATVFLFAAYPYASVYLGAEGMLGGEARDRIAGFWRALGLVPPAEPDHLAALLGLQAALADSEAEAAAGGDTARAALRRESRRALLWEHLRSWVPAYLEVVASLGSAYYAGWAGLVGDVLAAEAEELGAPDGLPLQLRLAPPLPEADGEGREWLAAILAPARSGIILTRADLRRAADELGLGVRAGERAFMLRSLFEQDAGRTLGWLATEAGRWAGRHGARESTDGIVAAFWRRRAEASAAALRAARSTTGRVVSHVG